MCMYIIIYTHLCIYTHIYIYIYTCMSTTLGFYYNHCPYQVQTRQYLKPFAITGRETNVAQR